MGISPFELNSQQVISNCIGLKGMKREETLQYHSRWIIIIILTTIHESFYPRFQLRCLSDGLNLVLFVKNRYNDCSIAMTLVSWQIFAALYLLPRVMDDGKTSEPLPPSYRIKKRPSWSKPHQSNPLEFLAFKAAALFLHYSTFSRKYARPPILSTRSKQCRSSTTIHDIADPIERIPSCKFTISFTVPLQLAIPARYRRPNPP